jgi:hypothetical protein
MNSCDCDDGYVPDFLWLPCAIRLPRWSQPLGGTVSPSALPRCAGTDPLPIFCSCQRDNPPQTSQLPNPTLQPPPAETATPHHPTIPLATSLFNPFMRNIPKTTISQQPPPHHPLVQRPRPRENECGWGDNQDCQPARARPRPCAHPLHVEARLRHARNLTPASNGHRSSRAFPEELLHQ